MNEKKVIIFSPSIYSFYTICVLKLMLQKKINIDSIIILNLLNKQRFKNEFGRDGWRLLKKIWKKLFLRDLAFSNDRVNLRSLKKDLDINDSSVVSMAKKNNIKIIKVNNFNSHDLVDYIESVRPHVGVFTGGGLLKSKIINCFYKGIINCHMGLLPKYRGMDVVEWPIIDKSFNLGLTTHLIDKGVDTGDIIRTKTYHVRYSNYELQYVRDEFEKNMCEMIVEDAICVLNGKAVFKKQDFIDGRQYFIMHDELKKKVKDILNEKKYS